MKTETVHDCMIYRSYGGVCIYIYHGPQKPTFLKVFMGNNLIFRSPKPFFSWFWGLKVYRLLMYASMVQKNTEYSSLKVAICNVLIARVYYIQLIHIKKQMTLDLKSNPTKKTSPSVPSPQSQPSHFFSLATHPNMAGRFLHMRLRGFPISQKKTWEAKKNYENSP